METSSRPVCLIAAGGTAGHVRPALAVAEALRERGARVTFAGSPDRVESRLVPEAGFELDTFAISGFPRRPGIDLVRASLARGARAVRLPADPRPPAAGRRPRRRRLRRRADGARRPPTWDPGGADRGGCASRAREPARRPVRAAGLPRVSDRRAQRREVPRRGTARAAVASGRES